MDIAFLRPEEAVKNIDREPQHQPRCELCFKPLKGAVYHILVQDDMCWTLPDMSGPLYGPITSIPLGRCCLRKLEAYSREYGFRVLKSDSPIS